MKTSMNRQVENNQLEKIVQAIVREALGSMAPTVQQKTRSPYFPPINSLNGNSRIAELEDTKAVNLLTEALNKQKR